jgi:nicotinamide phosphoribosyltransferase
LEAKGFASTNIVLGVGSFTYQYNTRDTFGFAMKATYVEVTELDRLSNIPDKDGILGFKTVGREIFKDPITDDGTKKSATGLLSVFKDDNLVYRLHDHCDWDTESKGELQTIYKDGTLRNVVSFEEIRLRLK